MRARPPRPSVLSAAAGRGTRVRVAPAAVATPGAAAPRHRQHAQRRGCGGPRGRGVRGRGGREGRTGPSGPSWLTARTISELMDQASRPQPPRINEENLRTGSYWDPANLAAAAPTLIPGFQTVIFPGCPGYALSPSGHKCHLYRRFVPASEGKVRRASRGRTCVRSPGACVRRVCGCKQQWPGVRWAARGADWHVV